jgi:hypothetical protein
MIEVLKQMQEALREYHYYTIDAGLPNQSMLNKGYAAFQAGKQAIAELESQEPLGKLQEPTAERAWFTIAELNAWADKKLSENPHWVMPKDEPERDESPPQRTWIGLTDDEFNELYDRYIPLTCYALLIEKVEAKLKEKNT